MCLPGGCTGYPCSGPTSPSQDKVPLCRLCGAGGMPLAFTQEDFLVPCVFSAQIIIAAACIVNVASGKINHWILTSKTALCNLLSVTIMRYILIKRALKSSIKEFQNIFYQLYKSAMRKIVLVRVFGQMCSVADFGGGAPGARPPLQTKISLIS